MNEEIRRVIDDGDQMKHQVNSSVLDQEEYFKEIDKIKEAT